MRGVGPLARTREIAARLEDDAAAQVRTKCPALVGGRERHWQKPIEIALGDAEIAGLRLQEGVPIERLAVLRIERDRASIGLAGAFRIGEAGNRAEMAIGGRGLLCGRDDGTFLLLRNRAEERLCLCDLADLEQLERPHEARVALGGAFCRRRNGFRPPLASCLSRPALS